jgi:hypothetical protein
MILCNWFSGCNLSRLLGAVITHFKNRDASGLGHRLISAHPDLNWSEFDAGEEIVRSLVVARGDGAVMFDFIKEALDKVSAPVKGG